MRNFIDASDTIRETAIVISISLTFVFLLLAAVIIPSVLKRGNLLNPIFLLGLILFGALGSQAFEIVGRLSFIGEGVKYGAAGFIILLLIGAATGGNATVAFLSGTIFGITLFYLKSIYAIYYIVKIETRKTDTTLSVSELEPLKELNHYIVDGVGSDFELINHIVEALGGGDKILYYARYDPASETRWSRLTEETIRFYANHLSPLHKIKSRRTSNIIKQIAFEASHLDTMERALFNYWLRAYLTGNYTSVIVPFDEDFVEKAAICERSYGESLEIKEILGDSDFLMIMGSLSRDEEGKIDVYSGWTRDVLLDRIAKVHPVV